MGEMGEILETDLTEGEGEPTPRAIPWVQQEGCQFELRTGPTGPAVKLEAMTVAGSPLGTAVATALLIVVGCVVMAVGAAIGLPVWAVISGFLAPAAVYAIIGAINRAR
jgi:hypothetical protein